MSLNKLTIKEAREKLDAGEITTLDLTKACLNRIKELNEKLNACLTVCEDLALKQAKEADERINKGEKGDLLGIPYIAKDNILTKGIRTTAASKILENYIAPYNATIIEKLEKAGAVLLGKSNLDEFAHGSSGENSAFGTACNPWDLSRVPGGTSSGSAVSVAANLCLFALGTDTGGSVRCPASFCGITGLKPTYGRSSRFGLIAATSSTDVPGPLTKTVEDASLVLKTIAGQDKKDATTFNIDVPKYELNDKYNLQGKTIGVPENFYLGANPEVIKLIKDGIKKYEAMGANIKVIDLPTAKYAIPAYYIINTSEISSNLARFDGIRYGFSAEKAKEIKEIFTHSRGGGFGQEAKRRIMLGTYVLSAGYYDAYYLKAQKVRTIITKELDEVLKKVDIIITPSQPDIAFKIGQQSDDPLKMYLEDVFQVPISLAGLPAISIPCGFHKDMPVGMQLIGKRFAEDTLFQFGHCYQKNTDWHTKKANI